MGLLCQHGSSLLSIGPFSTVSAITSSFQVCFKPVNYWYESLHVLLRMKENWLTNSWQSSTMALVKLWSNLVNFDEVDKIPSFSRGLGLVDFSMFGWFWSVLGSIGSPWFECPIPEKSYEGRNGVMTWVLQMKANRKVGQFQVPNTFPKPYLSSGLKLQG